ncbi:hypothetical protein HA052_24305 [Chromobacterium haemolyticum]|uniref:Phage tail protein n=1 Tax=Chromobacterium fluminis TaxID=3044269 RepID=A0ABX0L905_9NEIS|nr:hypothetical protein [Chromobacterium haemolyticum]NHR08319.1 hypothetical protein [Chromobacterium haemolyticum]
MSLQTRIAELAQAIGTDIKALTAAQGSLAALNTTQKSSLVGAINELQALAGGGAVIDDTAASAGKAYSSAKVVQLLADLKGQILGGASSAYDTLLEIEQKLGSDGSAIAGLLAAVNARISYADAQTLTAQQKAMACANIGIGDPDTDFVAAYNAGKA